jgi:hypothetical protein
MEAVAAVADPAVSVVCADDAELKLEVGVAVGGGQQGPRVGLVGLVEERQPATRADEGVGAAVEEASGGVVDVDEGAVELRDPDRVRGLLDQVEELGAVAADLGFLRRIHQYVT